MGAVTGRVKQATVHATCDTCGVGFIKWKARFLQAQKHYCSRSCQLSARSGATNPNWRGGPRKVPCAICHTEFEILPGSTKRFCTPACAHIGKKKPKAEKRKSVRTGEAIRVAREIAARARGTHTQEEWMAVLAQHGYRCARCGSTGKMTKDHITPISKGGSDGIQNIRPLCAPCNAWKGNRMNENFGIVSFDLALNVGWAVEQKVGERPLYGSESFHGTRKDIGYRGCLYVDWLYPFLLQHKPERVIYEAPFMTAQMGNSATLEILIGLAVFTDLICCRLDIPVSKASSSTARKFFCGDGRAKKPEVLAECRRRGWEPDDHDQADALCLLDYAVGLYKPNRYRRSYRK